MLVLNNTIEPLRKESAIRLTFIVDVIRNVTNWYNQEFYAKLGMCIRHEWSITLAWVISIEPHYVRIRLSISLSVCVHVKSHARKQVGPLGWFVALLDLSLRLQSNCDISALHYSLSLHIEPPMWRETSQQCTHEGTRVREREICNLRKLDDCTSLNGV